MKTRVAVVLPYFGNGGAENMVAHLVAHLDLKKVDVQVFCIFGKPQENHLEKEILSQGINIVYIGKGLGFSAKAVLQLYKELNKFKPDIVHTHLMGCMYAAPWVITHKVKMLHTLHSIPQSENRYKIRKFVTTILFRTRKGIPVAISEENRELIAKYYGMKKDKIEMANNPVVTKRYYHNTKRDEDICLITVGRLSPEKNQKLLIKVINRLKNLYPTIKLIIVGDGEEKGNLELETVRYDVKENVIFTGRVVDVENYLCNADIFVMSSLYEGVPLSILEAMAAGLPVVSTDVGGIKDIVTDNGILVPSEDSLAMEEAILKLINNPSLREEIGKKSLLNVQKYDVKNIAEQYTKLYMKYSKRNTDLRRNDEDTNQS